MFTPLSLLWFCIAILLSTTVKGKSLGTAMFYIGGLIGIYWFPNKGSVMGADVEKYEDMRSDKNPLYVRGHFRRKIKSQKIDSFFADLKIFYISQIQAIIQSLLLLIWGVSGFFSSKWHDAIWIIGAWCIITAVNYMIFGQYYRKILYSSGRISQYFGVTWKLFTNPGTTKSTPDVSLEYGFNSFQELVKHLEINLKESDYKLKRKEQISDGGKIWFYTNKTERYMNVFILIKVNKLEKIQCKELDDMTEDFLNGSMGKRINDLRYFVRCIYLVCAEHASQAYRELVMTAVHQNRRLYYLPTGICLEEGEFEIAEIEMNQMTGKAYREYENMQNEFLKLVDYEYPETFSRRLKRFKKMKEKHKKEQRK